MKKTLCTLSLAALAVSSVIAAPSIDPLKQAIVQGESDIISLCRTNDPVDGAKKQELLELAQQVVERKRHAAKSLNGKYSTLDIATFLITLLGTSAGAWDLYNQYSDQGTKVAGTNDTKFEIWKNWAYFGICLSKTLDVGRHLFDTAPDKKAVELKKAEDVLELVENL